MDEKLKQILETASRLFMRFGLRSVTMDDLAREAGVSKKTLYVHFKDKNDLVLQVFQFFMEDHVQCINTLCKTQGNAIDQWYAMVYQIVQDLGEIHPTLLYDMRKYHPEVWKMFNEHRNEVMLQLVTENLQLGIQEGLYRNDLDVDIVARLYINIFPMMMEGEVFPRTRFPFLKVHHEFFLYNSLAVSSDQGRTYLLTKYKTPLSSRIQ